MEYKSLGQGRQAVPVGTHWGYEAPRNKMLTFKAWWAGFASLGYSLPVPAELFL